MRAITSILLFCVWAALWNWVGDVIGPNLSLALAVPLFIAGWWFDRKKTHRKMP